MNNCSFDPYYTPYIRPPKAPCCNHGDYIPPIPPCRQNTCGRFNCGNNFCCDDCFKNNFCDFNCCFPKPNNCLTPTCFEPCCFQNNNNLPFLYNSFTNNSNSIFNRRKKDCLEPVIWLMLGSLITKNCNRC